MAFTQLCRWLLQPCGLRLLQIVKDRWGCYMAELAMETFQIEGCMGK